MSQSFEALHRSADETSQRLRRRASARGRGDAGAVSVSFEFFPPSTEKLGESLWRAIDRLSPLHPRFVSVTYGAGGSTRERTHNTVVRILRETALVPAAHLTCVAATRGEVDAVVQQYWEAGVRHIVALRGDPQDGSERFTPHPGGYRNAADLVAGIRRRYDIEISVGAYPEVHPDASSAQADMDNLKRKIDAGATRAITQFFFEPAVYLRFRDRAAAAGIDVPIVPGLLPVTNFQRIQGFAARCGASVPGWLADLFEGLDDAPDIRQLVAATVCAELATRLQEHGVDEFHFYTLNRAELTLAICRILGVRTEEPAQGDDQTTLAGATT